MTRAPFFRATAVIAVALAISGLVSSGCYVRRDTSAVDNNKSAKTASRPTTTTTTGVLLVSHGSHSPEWRKMLGEFHESVAPQLHALPGIGDVKSAFMEYTEPSIAAQLKRFDEQRCERVILVPLLLTVSSHSFDDIPTIVGDREDAKSLMTLQAQRIERYLPNAQVTITPLLDYSSFVEKNLRRRIAAISENPAREGVVLVAYGDQAYNEEWEIFFARLDQTLRSRMGLAAVIHCWCGHIVGYSTQPTQDAVRQILNKHDRALVVPVLVARDKFFQEELIGKAIEELNAGDRVAYRSDAILPDPELNAWVVAITRETLSTISAPGELPSERSP